MKLATIVLLPALACVLAAPARAQRAPGQPASQPASQPARAPGQPAPSPAQSQPGAASVTAPVAPPDVPQMRLSEVLVITARQEPSLQRATIDVRIAEAAVLEAAGIDDWVLQVAGGWQSQRVSFLDVLQNSLTVGADISRALRTGGTVTLHADSGFSDSFKQVVNPDYDPMDPDSSPVLTVSGITYNHTVYAALSQPLWRGFGEKYARSAQARARIAQSAAELELQQAALAAVRQVIAAYWELAYAWRDLEIRRASLVLGQEQLRNTQARIAAGAVAPTEALAVEQSIASREEAILLAQVSITDRSLALRDLAGLEIGPGEVALWADAPLDISAQQLDVNALLAQALAESPSLQALKVRQKDLALAVELAEDDTDPALDLDLLLGPTGSGGNPGEALEELVKLDQLTFNARLTLRHAFGQRTARGRLEAARERLQRLAIDANLAETQIKRELILAVQQAEAAQQRIALSERVIELAQRNIEAERARFELGRATNFDVLQRQDELEQAQLRRVRAVYDYLQALTAIDAITGGLLARYGIEIQPAGE
ncbi:MAG TPA: TolC family protein [Haliangium sp.]|nr:TolC family protein [Haliangium sp.]